MIVTAYLFIDQDGKTRLTRRDNASYVNELGLELKINVPNSFFKRRLPVAEIEVPQFFDVDNKTIVQITAPTIASALKLDVTKVSDGLMDMLEDEQREQKA